MKKLSLILITLLFLFSACKPHKESPKEYPKYDNGSYKTIDGMLNDCKGLTIIKAIGKQEGRIENASVDIMVMDSTKTFYTCSIGGTMGFQKGDTLKR
jgi:hypothetical protein